MLSLSHRTINSTTCIIIREYYTLIIPAKLHHHTDRYQKQSEVILHVRIWERLLLKCQAGVMAEYSSRSSIALSGLHLTAMVSGREKIIVANHLPHILYTTISSSKGWHSSTIGNVNILYRGCDLSWIAGYAHLWCTTFQLCWRSLESGRSLWTSAGLCGAYFACG